MKAAKVCRRSNHGANAEGAARGGESGDRLDVESSEEVVSRSGFAAADYGDECREARLPLLDEVGDAFAQDVAESSMGENCFAVKVRSVGTMGGVAVLAQHDDVGRILRVLRISVVVEDVMGRDLTPIG